MKALSSTITKTEAKFSNSFTGRFYSFLCIFLLFGMTFIIKLIPNVHPLFMNFTRHTFAVCLAFSMISSTDNKVYGTDPLELKVLLLRGFIGGIGLNAYWSAVYYVNLTIIFTMFSSTTIFVVFMAAWFLNEKLTMMKYICTFFSFLGIVMVILPSYSEDRAQPDHSLWEQTFGIILLAIAVLTISSGQVIIRKFSRSIGSVRFFLFFSFFGQFLSVLMICSGAFTIEIPSIRDSLLLILFSLVASAYQICYNRAFKFEKAANVSLIMQLTTIIGFLADILIFGVSFSFMSLFGCIVSIISTAYIIGG